MFLYHYYDKEIGPFVNLSDLSLEEGQNILQEIKKKKPHAQAAQRQLNYMEDRFHYEEILRDKFIEQGGIIKRKAPHYMVLEQSPWLSTWFDNCGCIKISIEEFDLKTLSFTYGDSHPTFSPRVNDGKEYRKKLYTYKEILKIIDQYGWPQEWNNDGILGPERYIEVHIWSDETINRYRQDII